MAAERKNGNSKIGKLPPPPGGASGNTTQSMSPELLISMYKEMILYRRFEERVNMAYTTKRKFAGFCHLHIGQEGLCVGVQKTLRPTDYMISAYRSHTQAIAKGIPTNQVLAELFGKVDGCSRGKGGSMHMFSKEQRFLGGHGIVGGQLPLAAGVGFAIKYRGETDICVCYLGDAASNQGQAFEAWNMAATWKLPVMFIIENNRYGMGTDIHRTTSIDHLWKRALAFDMEHAQIDGMNCVETYKSIAPLVESMRKNQRPILVEAMTYRYRGHSVSDPGSYRTREEIENYQTRDPILVHGQALIKQGLATAEVLEKWDEEAKEITQAAEDFADAAEKPALEELWMHVYAP